ncbi:hypothetical protein [Jannaschia aquimarina]|uniref:Uncharacterized protein n=1 Tax=Jannaschia aquimarina TaxID=935700 RepID=A0A0D1D8N7_9RHOB|nr:hypothetical protein [Jannaschia aquimarina]KIT16273.1 hypothetical protein jaqu_20270 [Jannaschia aquimarina]SNT14823.1 hypothetical protein SAMN05421775_106198 [Jannaschia aquimarina]
MNTRFDPAHARSPARAAIHARAQARAAAESVADSFDWRPDTALTFLAGALTSYAETDSFMGALDEMTEFALRRVGEGEVAFRDFDGRIAGTLSADRAEVIFAGVTASRLMREVISRYCAGPTGLPERAEVDAGGRTIHLAAARLSRGRMVRHVCEDTLTQNAMGCGMRAARLTLAPLPPGVLMLGQPGPTPED